MATPPADAAERWAIAPIVSYETHQLPPIDLAELQAALTTATEVGSTTIDPRSASCFEVEQGSFFRIVNVEGHQVGDLNLWNRDDLGERFYSGKTRQLHASHVSTGDHLWTSIPHLNPLCTIVEDSLDWYGIDEYGGSVHDVIGTRCDPYTNFRLRGENYHQCCHSNLSRALADHCQVPLAEAELHVHDVMNVFMCTGFTLDTHQYFMKATPARAGDHITFYAHKPLLGALSACPGGNCGSTHSDDETPCYPLRVDVLTPAEPVAIDYDERLTSAYDGTHGR